MNHQPLTMNLNRHNYEEFFLLYVDNELSAADRKAVDLFVQENPDLLMELNMLRGTVLQADDIVLDKKDWLYMEAEPTSLQQDLLLYADDELPLADRELVEGLLLSDKAAQAEWNILQHTKLQPETIVFEDKASLYRRDAGRVVGIKWWRVAAAAVLLGFGIWGGVSMYTNSLETGSGKNEVAGNGKTDQQKTQAVTPANSNPAISEDQNSSLAEINAASTAVNDANSNNNHNSKAQAPVTEKNRGNDNTASQNMIAAQGPERQDNNLPKPSLQNNNSSNSNQNAIASVEHENNINRVSGSNANVESNPINNSSNFNSRADQPVAVVQVSNPGMEADDSRYLNIEDKQKRTTLGGLIRKAKRVVERTTNINTGEGVKIAGFEIALK